MESKKEKSDRYYSYLACKRETFINHLTRVGAKLVNLNDGAYDLEEFLKEFMPPVNFLKNKIAQKASESQVELAREPAQKSEATNCIDSQLIEALRAEFQSFEKDFQNLLKATAPDELSSCASSLSCQESVVQAKPAVKAKSTPKKQENSKESPVVAHGSHYIHQVINPGEMSKIFVRKTHADVVNSKMDKPNFDDDNLETIYIYRSKNC